MKDTLTKLFGALTYITVYIMLFMVQIISWIIWLTIVIGTPIVIIVIIIDILKG